MIMKKMNDKDNDYIDNHENHYHNDSNNNNEYDYNYHDIII